MNQQLALAELTAITSVEVNELVQTVLREALRLRLDSSLAHATISGICLGQFILSHRRGLREMGHDVGVEETIAVAEQGIRQKFERGMDHGRAN